MHLNRHDLEELDLAGGELRTAQDVVEEAERKFKAICARIGAVPDLGGQTPAAKPKHAVGRPRTAKNLYAPEETITCTRCGIIITGVRYIGGVAYPYGHEDPACPGTKCNGSGLPGKRVTVDGNAK